MDCTQVSPNKHVNAAADYLQLEESSEMDLEKFQRSSDSTNQPATWICNRSSTGGPSGKGASAPACYVQLPTASSVLGVLLATQNTPEGPQVFDNL
jgi:hypothetical protein